MADIFLYPGVKEKLKLMAEWELKQLDNDDWRAIYGKPRSVEIDPLLSQMTAKDLELNDD